MALGVGAFLGIVLAVILLHIVIILGYRQVVPKEENTEDTKRWISKPKVEILKRILLALVIASWACSIRATAACNFVTISFSDDEDLMHLGLNAYDPGDNKCQLHSADDGAIRTGFAYGILNSVLSSFGVALAIMLIFVFRRGDRKGLWNTLRITMYISLWCCLFTFYIFEAKICQTTKCSLAPAGIAQIGNSVVLLLISFLMHMVPFGEYSDMMQEGETTESTGDAELVTRSIVLPNGNDTREGVLISAYLETRTLLTDGSIEHKVERLHADGNKSINITIDMPNNVTPLDTNRRPLDGVVVDSIPILDP